ncbi:LOW QUALITY PROTEIN: rho GTPase-activating protein 23 [Ornithorhynchus anatinus]|uniref:LOW QUALITY PROTEIN: rho GTPase-activating protein 23 n=1 Tax=Ornithorhynchus anatinus TaxID=9258 RepID=UPI0010A8AA84|nr:LOW QUALITY PROTEIN: rho GTPase-activating protein 23 [Ornithorhynchus anatinus]
MWPEAVSRSPGWCWERSVGVDCSGLEPRCLWLLSLRPDPGRPWPQTAGDAARRGGRTRAAAPPPGPAPAPARADGAPPGGVLAPCEPAGPGRTVLLRKSGRHHGFGFTLRHFIVYPPPPDGLHLHHPDAHAGSPMAWAGDPPRSRMGPAAATSTSCSRPSPSPLQAEEDGGRRGPPHSCLEPVDTIFVKSVKANGPAQQAGLRTGDRLVKVNGETITGKTYTQVITLIQNSKDTLALSIEAKNEDPLQMARSRDASPTGNEPLWAGARGPPEPPPFGSTRRPYPPQAWAWDTMVAGSRLAPRVDPQDFRPPLPCSRLAPQPGRLGRPAPPPRSPPMARPAPHPGAFSHGPAPTGAPQVPRGCPAPGAPPPPGPGRVPREAPLALSEQERRRRALTQWLCTQLPRRSSSEDRSAARPPPRRRSASQDRLGTPPGPAPWGWPHSVSQDALCHPGPGGCRARSDEALAPGGPPAAPGPPQPGPPALPGLDAAGYVGYRSYSPSFQRRTGLLHASSFRDPASGGFPTFSLTQRPAPAPAPQLDRPPPPASRPALPGPAGPPDDAVLRQKPPTGRKAQLGSGHPPDCALPGEGREETRGDGPGERPGRRVAPLAAPEDSLASIPFIDEPTSPSIDLKAKPVPASSVVSSCMNSAPVLTTSPSSPAFSFAISRHYSQDCSSIKAAGRRSSYLLAITAERSKSCDDGLNTFRDDSSVLRHLPSRVPSLRLLKSFFTDGSLDSLGTSEEPQPKRHSASDLSDGAAGEVHQEGWLHFKQILTKKGKKVGGGGGGGLRQWRRVFAVLRAHSLYLCKERREAGGPTVPPEGEEDPAPVSIRASLVDISYGQTKRRHVFRLTTADFCEYLFQAEDRDGLLGWVRAIRENSRAEGEDPGFASQALINKKLNSYRKVSPSIVKGDWSPKGPRLLGCKAELPRPAASGRAPRQDAAGARDDPPRGPWGINIMKKSRKVAPRAFGVRLEECQPAAENKHVPLIVEACCRVVEDKGLENLGIYRVPGNNAVVASLQEQLNKGAAEINPQDERWQDLNVISSLLKSFFRKLPEPLFTDDKYSDFIEANRLGDARERMKTLRKLIRDLPGHYYETLKFLVGHLRTIADHSEKNKMEPRNLALVFGPTLVRTSEDNMTDMVTHMPDRYKIVETLIQHSNWFFSDEEDKGEKTPVDDKEAQAVPNIEYLLPNLSKAGPPCQMGADPAPGGLAKYKRVRASGKEPYRRELLAISFISAVNRKRKKRREARHLGSSTDEDSDPEAAAAPPLPGAAGPAAPAEGPGPAAGPSGLPGPPGEPPAAPPAPDCRSLGSGGSTLSTLARSVCSEPPSGGEGRAGDEADDERSELSQLETDTEGGAAAPAGRPDPPPPPPSPPPPRRPSFSSHRLMQCDTLARRRLSRSRPDGGSPRGSLDGDGPGPGPGSGSSSSQDSLAGPGGERHAGALGALTQQLRLRLRGSADDLLGVRLRRPCSPETRRKKSSWRRHTVVLQCSLTDLNCNEWKELSAGPTPAPGRGDRDPPPPAFKAPEGPESESKDSGISSLESTKARPSSASLAPARGT